MAAGLEVELEVEVEARSEILCGPPRMLVIEDIILVVNELEREVAGPARISVWVMGAVAVSDDTATAGPRTGLSPTVAIE